MFPRFCSFKLKLKPCWRLPAFTQAGIREGGEGSRWGDNARVTDKETLARWVKTWQEYGPELEQIRLREVREEDNRLSLQLLAPAFEHARLTAKLEASSGLVEMQKYFQKLRV